MYQVIHLHPEAPPKPAQGAACNGCGVCCASAPCPIGMVLGGRLGGPCPALTWSAEGLYRCGWVDRPADLLPARWRAVAPLAARMARRMIAAGAGCDCSLQVGGDVS